MKKNHLRISLVVLVIFVSMFFYNKINAMSAPYFNLNIVSNSASDDTYNYIASPYFGYSNECRELYDSYSDSEFDPTEQEIELACNHLDIPIITNNGVGSRLFSTNVNNGDVIYLVQAISSSSQLSDVVCTSDNPNVVSEQFSSGLNKGVAITARQFSSITCTFTNTNKQNKTPVIIVPGVMGTEMKKGDELLWVDLWRMLTDVGDQFMDPLQFQTTLSPTNANLSLGDIIRKKILDVGIGNATIYDYSDHLINEFKDQGYTEGTSSDATLFTFPYDWRYGVSGIFSDGKTNEDLLKQKIQDVMTQTGSNIVDLVAHSTGGLVVKKYVMDNPSDNHIDKAVFVGVPNTGAPKAIKALLQGDDFGIPFLSNNEMKKISRNLPVAYDLLPSKQYYDVKGSYIKQIDQGFMIDTTSKDLNYEESNDFLINDNLLNATALTNANNLHTPDFDNYDMRNAGVNLFSIDGCKAGTLSRVIKTKYAGYGGVNGEWYEKPDETPGDGTVPLESSTNLPINQENKFYALVSSHAEMLGQEGIRQEITNIISGSNLSVNNNLISQDISKCKLNGKGFSVFSPIDLEITDNLGNKIKINPNGSVQNDIPNADFQIWGDHKFAFLPDDEGQTYDIKMQGTGNGTYTIKSDVISDNIITKSEIFSNLPVTSELTGNINIADTTTLLVQSTPTSTTQTINPSATLDSEEVKDLLPPVSTSTISGTKGANDYYRSDVSVTLNATDIVGILATQYNLDNQGYQQYSSSTPIAVSINGLHNISFYSTDNAGNNEQPKTITFVVDKTTPEFVFSVDPKIFELEINGFDSVSSTTISTKDITEKKKKDNKLSYIVSDLAGNTSNLTIETNRENDRKLNYDINFPSIKGAKEASMIFERELDKKGNLKTFTQTIKQGRDVITYTYNVKKDKTIVRTRDGKIIDKKVYNEQKKIEFISNNGVIEIK